MKYISECREMGIAVVPPDVQYLATRTSRLTRRQAIGFGLAAIKNVGHNAIDSILARTERVAAEGQAGFASLWEFCEKVDLRLMNKRVLESLIKAGAMDAFGPRVAGDGGAGQGDGARAEVAARCGCRAARAVRHLRRRRPVPRATAERCAAPCSRLG